MYIRSTACISPQHTFKQQGFLQDPVDHTGTRFNCSEPDYKTFIDPKMIRRMSRIIKMGVAAGMACLEEGGISNPDAITTGTAYGCLEDTGVFLGKLVEQNEELLTPTAFIQSTHNTIGAQIALQLHCTNYNNAFVHRGFSFESALLDGMMLIKEKEVNNVLVGAIDEITDASHNLLTRLGLYRKENNSGLDLLKEKKKGTVNGEGAAFFLVADTPADTDYARIDGLTTFYKPADHTVTTEKISAFLAGHGCTLDDIDLIITGRNGDERSDNIFDQLERGLFAGKVTTGYKHLCGDYPTSGAFAMWLAASIIKTNSIPAVLGTSTHGPVKRILIYNHQQNIQHSLFLLSAC